MVVSHLDNWIRLCDSRGMNQSQQSLKINLFDSTETNGLLMTGSAIRRQGENATENPRIFFEVAFRHFEKIVFYLRRSIVVTLAVH